MFVSPSHNVERLQAWFIPVMPDNKFALIVNLYYHAIFNKEINVFPLIFQKLFNIKNRRKSYIPQKPAVPKSDPGQTSSSSHLFNLVTVGGKYTDMTEIVLIMSVSVVVHKHAPTYFQLTHQFGGRAVNQREHMLYVQKVPGSIPHVSR